MEKLNRLQLLPMLQLQQNLNARIDADWKDKNYPWLRAAWVECAELMDHIGWKWWKDQEPNLVQAQIELVDIWHFMLSEWLNETPKDETIENSADLMLDVMYDGIKWTPEQQDVLDKHQDLHVLIDAFSNLCSGGIWNVHMFARMMQLLDMNWTNLYQMYVAKNVMNTFRQDNGYAVGSYIKDWSLDLADTSPAVEDNEVLAQIFGDNPTWDPVSLQNALMQHYHRVLIARGVASDDEA